MAHNNEDWWIDLDIEYMFMGPGSVHDAADSAGPPSGSPTVDGVPVVSVPHVPASTLNASAMAGPGIASSVAPAVAPYALNQPSILDRNDPLWVSFMPLEVHLTILRWLPLWQIRILTKSRILRSEAYRTLHMRVSDFFEHWELPVRDTLWYMRLHNAIIIDEVALAIVKPHKRHPARLDFVVPFTEATAFARWLHRNGYGLMELAVPPQLESHFTEFTAEDYKLAPEWYSREDEEMCSMSQHATICPNSFKGVLGWVKYQHYIQNADGQMVLDNRGLVIRLYVSCSESPIVPIPFLAPSTHLMNFVTGDGVVCPYPAHVFKNKGMLTMHHPPRPHSSGNIDSDAFGRLVDFQGPGGDIPLDWVFFTHCGTVDPDELSLPFLSSKYDITHMKRYVKSGFVDERLLGARCWNDPDSLSMDFSYDHPINISPPVIWRTSYRYFCNNFYTDYPTYVRVFQDGINGDVIYRAGDKSTCCSHT
ncbi:hypothetical protein FA13DRAFT_1819525 [Coprinellus micaceus]|uniref:Uncharacterized protein n=1 Tax=Coprinellus micaceus TaxID=71717 RepID=A0A4Y7SHY0_COPMI|nr:hypothetical protein FA13DRAFT_1819525 [Coprinellus micaceus]